MELQYPIYKTNNTFKEINRAFNKLKPIVKEILYNIDFSIIKEHKLKSVDLFRLIKDVNKKDCDLKGKHIMSIINKYIDKYNIYDYFRFISDFTPVHIFLDIIKNYTDYKKLCFQYNTNTINLNIFSKTNTDYQTATIKALKVLSVLEYCNIKNANINISYALTNHKKELPEYKILGPASINSGVTIHRFNGDIHITLYRQEESDKVLLHELIHYLKLDFALCDNDFINNLILDEFNIINNMKYINLFEAYTDSIAIIFNSILNCILLNENINNYFQMELNFIESQMNNILNFFQFKSPAELLDKKSNKLINQNTSVLSYYILKYFLIISSYLLLTEYFPKTYTDWTPESILNMYNLCKKNLISYKSKSKRITNNSLCMSYNTIIY